MGCDIHAFVEYDDLPFADGCPAWTLFATLHMGRNYDLFTAINGVRGNKPGVVENRGVPRDISWTVVRDYTYQMTTETDYEARQIDNVELERLKQWAGDIETWDAHHIIQPDWHSATWLTTNEVGKVCERCASEEMRAVYAMMERLPKARLIVWYDN